MSLVLDTHSTLVPATTTPIIAHEPTSLGY